MLALAGWIAGTTVAAGAWDSVRESSITAVDRPLDAEGQSVAVFTDVVQPERQVSCAAADNDDDTKKPEPFPEASLDLVVNDNGDEWHLIGFEPEGRNGMVIRCTPRDKGSDNATYATSVVDGFTDKANTGNGIAILGTVAGIGLAIWTFIARRRHQHRERNDASA